MASTTPTRAADAAIAVTSWTSTLLTQEFATSELVDTSAMMDALVGGSIAAATATGTIVVGDRYDIYILGVYSDTDTDIGGAIDALLGEDGEEAADTAFVLANMELLKSVAVKSASPDGTYALHWGPYALAQFFGGVMPKKIMLILHVNTNDAALGTGSNVNISGITYDTS